ncbi:TolB family protein [Actinoalloteichus sp. GBA129-24]|uniref:TolB family protein n=1 Tax=Actinoalloteichus sp. GBA129-24 TaxID=1612551 RepID=UPI00095083BD|nr:DPP IV N-terminal domain-containing protein [Actinoalloteichus sp. GBA129-24]APU21940.1 WD40-like beta propeller repeat protein [Actinoalloteichus sp. GBA129-24]
MRPALPSVVTATAAALVTLAFPATAAAAEAINGPIHFGSSSVINPDGTDERRIPERDTHTYYSDFLSFSPDGENTLYVTYETPEPDSMTMLAVDNPEYTAPTTLVTSGELDASYIGNASWSPDGEWIAFRFADSSGSHEMGMIRPDGTDLTVLTVPSHLDSHSVSWLPDSSGIVYTRSPVFAENYLCTITITTDSSDCVDLPGGQEWFFDRAQVSPDGTTVLLTSQIDVDPELGSTYDLMHLNIDGTGMVNLTENETGDQTTDAVWSPDGTAIAFVRSNSLWTMDADGGNDTQLSTSYGNNIAWQPVF